MSKKEKKAASPDNKKSTPEPKEKSKFEKGTLVCTRNIRDGGDTYTAGDEYKGTNKDTTKRLLERGAIKKV